MEFVVVLVIVCVGIFSARALAAKDIEAGRGLEVGVCITGQMQRLEVKTKIDHLFKFGVEQRDHIFDLVLVMNKNLMAAPVYVNLAANASSPADAIELLDPVRTVAAFSNWTRSLTELYIDMPEEPVISPQYLAKLNDKSKQSDDKRLLRAKSHVRQWYYMRRCYDAFRKRETELMHKFDVFVRLRDDNFLLGNMDPGFIVADAPRFPRTIIISNCESWRKHGINDKGAIVSRMAAHIYFTAPLDFYYLYPDKVFHFKTTNVLSPEIWINHVYNRVTHMNIVRDVSRFPVMTSRRMPKSEYTAGWCLAINMEYSDSWQLRCYTSGDEVQLIKGVEGAFAKLEKHACSPIPSTFIARADVLTTEERSQLTRAGAVVPDIPSSNFRPDANSTAESKVVEKLRKRLAKINGD